MHYDYLGMGIWILQLRSFRIFLHMQNYHLNAEKVKKRVVKLGALLPYQKCVGLKLREKKMVVENTRK